MASMSHMRLHTRPYMLRALSRAGQFAHLAPSDIEGALDDLYSRTYRLRIMGTEVAKAAEAAVPWAFVKAGRLLIAPAYDARTVNYIAHDMGVTCCLCLKVGYDQAPHLDPRFGPFYCPTHLRSGPKTPLPFCYPCGNALANWVWRNFGFNAGQPIGDHAIYAAAAWLVANRTFRERVQDNAYRLAELRFDPRSIQTWGKRPLKSRTRTCERCGGKRSIKAQTCRACFRAEFAHAA